MNQIIVTAEQMRQIEAQIFAQGMPVAALMEKAALLVARRIEELYPVSEYLKVGVLVGPGHNGGDALVVARELYLGGYHVLLYRPFEKVKELTGQHWHYAVELLKIPVAQNLEELQETQIVIDGCFGFGLTRPLEGQLAEAVDTINEWSQPVISIDIPSGIHTDTGEILGTAIRATHTLCLGMWKRGFFQDAALEYLGKVEKIDFGIPPLAIERVLEGQKLVKYIDRAIAEEMLPIPRRVSTHKYQQGHLLLICGSVRYGGAAILAGLGARATGIGMLSIAVPKSLKSVVLNHLPEALVIACEETNSGAIASLPVSINGYQAIACGPGLTLDAQSVVKSVLETPCPLILDADGLNIVSQAGLISSITQRQELTVMTPHPGEFKRVFPEIDASDRLEAVQIAAQQSQSVILLKGAKTAIAAPSGERYVVGESTPALARGGSGDVLTGLIGGLVASNSRAKDPTKIVALGAWWHSQAAILAATNHTELGVDALTLSQYLCIYLSNLNP